MGTSVTDLGKPVLQATALGDCGTGTRLGGYSLITADDLEAALKLAKGCPSLEQGGGIEVGGVEGAGDLGVEVDTVDHDQDCRIRQLSHGPELQCGEDHE